MPSILTYDRLDLIAIQPELSESDEKIIHVMYKTYSSLDDITNYLTKKGYTILTDKFINELNVQVYRNIDVDINDKANSFNNLIELLDKY